MAYVNSNGKLIFDKITDTAVIQANYLASMQDEHMVDDVINIYTGVMPWNWFTPPCSHTEIGFWVDGELWFFSSTSRKELGTTGKTGTRWIKASDLLRNPDRWLLQEKKETIANIAIKAARANKLIGLEYDFYGVGADFINPARVIFCKRVMDLDKLPKKIYCSKAVHAVDTGWLWVFSPKRRYKWAKKNSYASVGDTKQWLIKKGVLNWTQ